MREGALQIGFATIDFSNLHQINALAAVADLPAGQVQILESAVVVSIRAKGCLSKRVSSDLADFDRAPPPKRLSS
jgi:hypothetical protein